ncbi:hypothetical protein GBA52_007160 [Prunus armeniaca]|nr:hypothetical protein GBA52_007160 [Prunus armeniaca]
MLGQGREAIESFGIGQEAWGGIKLYWDTMLQTVLHYNYCCDIAWCAYFLGFGGQD